MADTHTYSIANDTLNGIVTAGMLHEEIVASSIIPVLNGISTVGDVITIIFATTLSGAEITTLNGVVAAHAGLTLDPEVARIQSIRSSGASTTTSTSYQLKLELASSPLVRGHYLIQTYCEISLLTGGLGDIVQARMTINGTSKCFTHATGTQWFSFSGMQFRNIDNGATPSVKIEYRISGSGGDTAQIKRGRIIIQRIGKNTN